MHANGWTLNIAGVAASRGGINVVADATLCTAGCTGIRIASSPRPTTLNASPSMTLTAAQIAYGASA